MTMTSEAKRALSTTIRYLRQRLLDDLKDATELSCRLLIGPRNAGLDESESTRRRRLENWVNEQHRTQPAGNSQLSRKDFLRETGQ